MTTRIRFFLLFALVARMGLFGQVEQGAITGRVTDKSGAVAPGVQVTVREIDTNVTAETRTNTEGHYTVPYLRPGRYEIIAAHPGFTRARVTNLVLTVGLTATVNLSIEPSALQETVTVESGAATLELQNATLGNAVVSSQITELPLLGRNPYSLVQLAPGVAPKGGNAGPIIGGGRSTTNAFLVDGADVRNTTTNDVLSEPPLEAVQEFRVITNSLSAEYGRTGGGVLTAATRSGTNELHGTLYEYLRNDKLNANGWNSNRLGLKRTGLRRNEFGASAGGPIYLPKLYDGRNRSFFFVNWERALQRSPNDFIATVPTERERQGDFSETFDLRGQPIRIFDWASTRPDPARPGRYIRDAFPGNRIPSARLDPIAQRVMTYFPLPNRSTRTENFVRNNSGSLDTSRLFVRADHHAGSRHRLFLTYGWQKGPDLLVPGVSVAFPEEGTNGQNGMNGRIAHTSVLSDTVIINPGVIGEFRAGFTRRLFFTSPRSKGFDFTQLGFPQELKARASLLQFPRFNVVDASNLGPNRAGNFDTAQQNPEVQGHVTFLRGSHTLKTGGNLAFTASNVTRPEYPSGFYSFNRVFTQGPDPQAASGTAGHGVASLLLGVPAGGQFSTDPSLAASQRYYGLYVQDDWRALRNLTLNIGLRWEYYAPWTDRYNQLAFFDPAFRDPLTGNSGSLRFVARDGNSRYQTNPDRNNFSPRFGLAWQIAPKMVVRAGYGLIYFPGNGGIGGAIADLGSGFQVITPVVLGPPSYPNTPPPGASLAKPFQAGFAPSPSAGIGSSVDGVLRSWPTPFVHQWNLNIQRALAKNLLVEAAYVGSRAQRIWTVLEMNAASTDYLGLGPQLDQVVPNPYAGKIDSGALSLATVRRSQLLLPYSHYTSVENFRAPVGDSIYHGFTLRVDKSWSQGFHFQASYTVAKLIDNVPERFAGRSGISDPNNLDASRSVGDYDRPQYLVLNYIYDLPWGPGKKWLSSGWQAHVLGGWQVSGVTVFGSGVPLVINAPSNTGLPNVSARPVRLKDPVLAGDRRTLDRWFDTAAFQSAPAYTLGNDSRTQPNLRGPGTKSFDVKIGRNFRLREKVNLQFRTEFFNAFNTPQFGDPVTAVTSLDFGRVLSSSSPRNVQFGLRLSY